MDQSGISLSDREKALTALGQINSVFGFMDLEPQPGDQDVEALIERREQARKDKSWDLADGLRRELAERNIEVIDTKQGPLWRIIRN